MGQIEQVMSGNYKAFSEQAALFERQKHWKEAALYWQHAEEKAKNGFNKKWAACRQDFCLLRAFNVVPDKYHRNDNDITTIYHL